MEVATVPRFAQCLVLTLLLGLRAHAQEDRCWIADSVVPVKTMRIHHKVYTLVLRTSGMHEKVNLFELYPDRPIFDQCGKTSAGPIVSRVLEDDPQRKPIKVIIRKLDIFIVYSNRDRLPADIHKIPVEIDRSP
jgi:hypothetical protein